MYVKKRQVAPVGVNAMAVRAEEESRHIECRDDSPSLVGAAELPLDIIRASAGDGSSGNFVTVQAKRVNFQLLPSALAVG